LSGRAGEVTGAESLLESLCIFVAPHTTVNQGFSYCERLKRL
jgi:hypothetical protein